MNNFFYRIASNEKLASPLFAAPALGTMFDVSLDSPSIEQQSDLPAQPVKMEQHQGVSIAPTNKNKSEQENQVHFIKNNIINSLKEPSAVNNELINETVTSSNLPRHATSLSSSPQAHLQTIRSPRTDVFPSSAKASTSSRLENNNDHAALDVSIKSINEITKPNALIQDVMPVTPAMDYSAPHFKQHLAQSGEEPKMPPQVHITIDHLEVRGQSSTSIPKRSLTNTSSQTRKKLSLESYFQRRYGDKK